MFQFVQKVYNWDAEFYSYMAAGERFSQTVASICVVPVLVKLLKMKDTRLGIIGIISYFVQNLIRGTLMTPNYFYLSLIIGALGGMGTIGIRAHLSKIISQEELGTVFSLMGSLDAMAPFIASSFFTTIFNTTLDTNPGLGMQMAALVLLIPFGVLLWIDLCTIIPVFSINDKQVAINSL